MPPAPKSPQGKRPGAPKAKGAVRAKSGCYTCRIRRKKCDEKMNSDGSCGTCVRLRLQCLGFGAKRPDWLRVHIYSIYLPLPQLTLTPPQDSRNVVDLKGKDQVLPRFPGNDQRSLWLGPSLIRAGSLQILHLSHEYASPSTTPQTPTLSISSSNEDRIPSVYPPFRGPPDSDCKIPFSDASILRPLRAQQLAPGLPVMHESPDSPGYHEVTLPPFSTPGSIDSSLLNGPDLLAGHFHPTIPHRHLPALSPPRPHTSDFSKWHSVPSPGYNDDDLTNDVSSAFLLSPNVPYQFHFNLDGRQNTALKYYMDNVLRMQVPSCRRFIGYCPLGFDSLERYGKAELLAPAEMSRLQMMFPPKQPLNEGDALAGTLVSGKPFSTPPAASPSTSCKHTAVLLACYGSCTDSLRFIIKTSIWFDVLASSDARPHSRLCWASCRNSSPPTPMSRSTGIPLEPCEEYSMLSIMGCDNHIVYALAEIAALAAWKERNRKENRLSVPELVRRGQRIEDILKKQSSLPTTSHDPAQDERSRQRMLTSEVFRASAHVYLHSVISGDYPQCPEIIEAVDRTFGCLKVAESGQTGRAVVRSVVFSICIAGCLTDNSTHKEYLRKRLKEQRGIGNCSQVQHLISEVWRRRGKEQVDWRQVMQEAEMLLV
ncbi:fungal-specific transcription factor domain-containing protein [Pisolithus croceorrhizus]|nr:fungal-specific transcription factor domain-containing protein [Pisolithus croceorrhizus]